MTDKKNSDWKDMRESANDADMADMESLKNDALTELDAKGSESLRQKVDKNIAGRLGKKPD